MKLISRKILSLLLALCLTAGFALPAYAAGEEPLPPVAEEEPAPAQPEEPEPEAPPAEEESAPAEAKTEPEPEAEPPAGLLETAETDGAAAAALLNAVGDEAEYLAGLRLVLNLYYGNEESYAGQLAAFCGGVDGRAAELLEKYAQAARERAAGTRLGYLPGEVIVVFKPQVSAHGAEEVLSAQSAELTEVPTTLGSQTMATAEIPLELTVEAAVEQYSADPAVDFAQPVFLYGNGEETLEPQNDTNDNQFDYLHHLESINATAAWGLLEKDQNLAASNPKKVRVAVLDNMPDLDHPDLQANISRWEARDFQDYHSNENLPKAAGDSHGTYVTGLIGATANNGLGTAGVAAGAANNIVEILPMNVHNSKDPSHYSWNLGDSHSIAHAVEYAAGLVDHVHGTQYMKNPVDIIHISVYHLQDDWAGSPVMADGDRVMQTAIKNATAAGVLVVAPAGNKANNTQLAWPAAMAEVVSVINLKEEVDDPAKASDTTAFYADTTKSPRYKTSSYATATDLANSRVISAPGTNVTGTMNGKKYGTLSASSVSAAVVTGVAALIKYANPGLSPAGIWDILKTTARDVYTPGADTETGHGCVDAAKAVLAARGGTGLTGFDIRPSGGLPGHVYVGGSLQLEMFDVLPAGATATDLVWSSNNTGVATVDQNGLVTGLAAGTAQITLASALAGVSKGYAVSVTVPPTGLDIQGGDITLTLGTAGQSAIVFSGDNLVVRWQLDNNDVAAIFTGGGEYGSAVTVKGLKPGTTILRATTLDGALTASRRVTVLPGPHTASFEQRSLRMVQGGSYSFVVNVRDNTMPVALVAVDADTGAPVNLFSDLADDDSTAGQIEFGVTASGTLAPGRYLLRACADGTQTIIYDEMEVELVAAAALPADEKAVAALHAHPNSISYYTRKNLNTLSLRQGGTGATIDLGDPASVAGVEVRSGDDVFTFTPLDRDTLKLSYNPPAKAKSSYSFYLDVIVKTTAGDKRISLPEKITVKINQNQPKLTAPAVAVNSFYEAPASRTAQIAPTGGTVLAMDHRADKKAANQAIDWIDWANPDTNLAAGRLVIKNDTTAKKSATLYLRAYVQGWGSQATEADWVNFTVKLSRNHTAPGVKLSSGTLKLYTDFDRSAGHTLSLKPKSSKNTLAGLGIHTLRLAAGQSSLWKLENFSLATGSFRLSAVSSTLADLKGPIKLEAVTTTGETIPLSLKVKQLAASTKVTLKPSAKTITLNPNLKGGESVTITMGANIEGYTPAAGNVYTTQRVSGPSSPAAPTATVSGNSIRFTATEDTPAGASWKVKVELLNAYVNKAGDHKAATVTLTVKTVRATTDKTNYGAKAGFSAKGKVDLTTGGAATLTAKFTNYSGGFAGGPVFTVTDSKGKATNAAGKQLVNQLRFTPSGTNSWLVTPAPGGSMAPGSYRVSVDTYTSPLAGGSRLVSAGTAKLTVKASKPKLTQSVKELTLYNNDAGSAALIQLATQAGYKGITKVEVKHRDPANYTFATSRAGAGNSWLLGFNGAPANAEDLRKNAAGTTLTLNVWAGSSETPVATVKLRVNVQRWA